MQRLICLVLVLTSVVFADKEKERTVADARAVIQSLNIKIVEHIAYSNEELNKRSLVYQSEYVAQIKPKFKDISKVIPEKALHWIDVDFDGNKDLVFWTEGFVTESGWGVREKLFVIDAPVGAEASIKKMISLDHVSFNKSGYKYVCFFPKPNKDKGYNDTTVFVFSYGHFGASGSTFIHHECVWDRYGNDLDIRKFMTSFPFEI